MPRTRPERVAFRSRCACGLARPAAARARPRARAARHRLGRAPRLGLPDLVGHVSGAPYRLPRPRVDTGVRLPPCHARPMGQAAGGPHGRPHHHDGHAAADLPLCLSGAGTPGAGARHARLLRAAHRTRRNLRPGRRLRCRAARALDRACAGHRVASEAGRAVSGAAPRPTNPRMVRGAATSVLSDDVDRLQRRRARRHRGPPAGDGTVPARLPGAVPARGRHRLPQRMVRLRE